MTAPMIKTPGYYRQRLKQMPPEEQTEDFCLMAVQTDPYLLNYVACQTDNVCLAAVKKNGYALMHVQQQTPELCEAAVTQNAIALQFVQNQTHELCMLAVQAKGMALQQVKGLHTVELCAAAVSNNGRVLEFVDLPSNCLTDPASSQLANWNRVLEACEKTDPASIALRLLPLIEAVPLGKQVKDEWQQNAPDGRFMLDHLVVLAEHIKRLAPEDHKVKPFMHKVNEQVEGALARQAAVEGATERTRYRDELETQL